MTQAPVPTPTGPEQPRHGHHGWLVLLLGLGAVVCFPLGLIAWFIANRDLRAMQAGRMDRAGRRLTRIGRYLGIAGAAANVLLIALAVISQGG